MNAEIEKRRTFAIVSHPDAGKTTITAKLHNRLRDEYKKLALTANSINERDIINADTKVLADTINEFMVDLLLI